MTIRTDHQTLAERWTTQEIISDDVRIFRRWDWLLANEPNLKMEFLPSVQNSGVDLLTRPLISD